MDMYINEVIDMAELKKRIEEIDKEIAIFQNKAYNENCHTEEEALTEDKLYLRIKEKLAKNQNTAIKELIEVITVNSSGEVKIFWKKDLL